MSKFGYTKEEEKLFRRLNTPKKIQDYLNAVHFNFDERGGTCMSPRRVIKGHSADCVEGAVFAAAALEFHSQKPWILDLRSVKKPYDYDHVVAVFKQFGCFGAISKTNHGVLRYREPVYKSVRELAMSFFHEYFLENGQKTLREYSELFDLSKFKEEDWRTGEGDLSALLERLDRIKHHKILSKEQIKNLRKADMVEIEMGKIVEFKKDIKKAHRQHLSKRHG